MEYFVISAKFVPLKYYTLSSQLQRLASFSVGCSGRRILSPGQINIMRKWCIILVVHVCKQWPMKRHISRWKTAPTNTLVLACLVKHHGDLDTRSARSYSTSRHICGMTNTSPTLYCICWVTVLSMSIVEEVEARYCSLCIWTIGSYFPLRVGNTCATYDLQRFHNDLPLSSRRSTSRPTHSGVAKTFPLGAAHLEDQNEEENEENLRKNGRKYREMRKAWGKYCYPAHPGVTVRGLLRPCLLILSLPWYINIILSLYHKT